MKKLIMNEKKYIDNIEKNASMGEKIYSYDFPKVINLFCKYHICKEYKLSENEEKELREKAKKGFNHHMNYDKDDKNKEYPKRKENEIYEAKKKELVLNKTKDLAYNNIVESMKKVSYSFNELQWKRFIELNIKNQITFDFKLKEIDKIYITKKDLIIINNEKLNSSEKRLLFTYMVIAKYYNQEMPTNSNINISVNNMFKFANMGSMKKEFKILMINHLQDLDLLKVNLYHDKNNRNISYKVLQCESSNENNDNVFFISCETNEDNILEDIGKSYKDMIKLFNNDKLKQCERCGLLFEKTNGCCGIQKYCKKCSDEINRINTKMRLKENRNNKNV